MKMKEELFTNLPTEIVIDILSRLPIQSIIMCKFVCKSWRDLVDSIEFAMSHLCKAVPHLVVFLGKDRSRSIPYKMVEFVDEHRSAHRCKIVSNLSFPYPGVILGSINGLLFWCNGDLWSRDLFVCNPITREYIKLPPPPPPEFEFRFSTAGVGVSKMTGQYKIVRILQVFEHNQLDQCECQLHTLGTGLWRSFSAGTQLEYRSDSVGAFLNENLHWLARDSRRVSCFDLETELFTSFSSPPGLRGRIYKTLSVVRDRLCFCDSISGYGAIIWLMSEYGDEKSWTKEFIIREDFPGQCRELYGWLFPIKVFTNGDILIAREHNNEIFCCSKTTNAIHNTGIHNRDPLTSNYWLATSAVIYTPSFLPLRTLVMVTDNVSSF